MTSKLEAFSVCPDPDCQKCEGRGGTYDDRDAFRRCECNDHMLHSRRIRRSGISQEFYGKTLAGYRTKNVLQAEAVKSLGVWVQSYNPESRWVYLCGDTGGGKTHLACALLVALSKAYFQTVYFSAVHDFLRDAKSFGGRDDAGISEAERAFDRAIEIDALVLDDLGAEQLTDFAADRLYALIDTRYRAKSTTIITSNLDKSGLKSRYDARLVDRILGKSLFIEIDGESRERVAEVGR